MDQELQNAIEVISRHLQSDRYLLAWVNGITNHVIEALPSKITENEGIEKDIKKGVGNFLLSIMVKARKQPT